MSSSNPQRPSGSDAGDTERTREIPVVGRNSNAPKNQSSRPSSTGASPASRKVAGSGSSRTTSASSEPRTVGEALAARAGSEGKGSGAAGEDPASSSATTASGVAAGATAAARGATGTKKSSASPRSSAGAQAPTTGTKNPDSTTSATSEPDAKSSTGAGKGAVAGAATTTPRRGGAKQSPAGNEAPMTARDYARTTRESADTTSVIPAVQDRGQTQATPGPAGSGAAQATDASGRRARLQLVRVEPWSITRLAFVVSVALMIVSVIAVLIFWVVLDLAGVWDSLNGTITNVLSDGETGFDLTDYLGVGRLVGLTLLLSAINVLVMTMMATIAAHLYNYAAQLMGGIEVTFSDR